ncbi:hypothetical protein ACFU6R_24605 [Streptomyces sp. NPDC057499]
MPARPAAAEASGARAVRPVVTDSRDGTGSGRPDRADLRITC